MKRMSFSHLGPAIALVLALAMPAFAANNTAAVSTDGGVQMIAQTHDDNSGPNKTYSPQGDASKKVYNTYDKGTDKTIAYPGHSNNANQLIQIWGFCGFIDNDGQKSYLVPGRTAVEWNAFVSHHPSEVDLVDGCRAADYPKVCGEKKGQNTRVSLNVTGKAGYNRAETYICDPNTAYSNGCHKWVKTTVKGDCCPPDDVSTKTEACPSGYSGNKKVTTTIAYTWNNKTEQCDSKTTTSTADNCTRQQSSGGGGGGSGGLYYNANQGGWFYSDGQGNESTAGSYNDAVSYGQTKGTGTWGIDW